MEEAFQARLATLAVDSARRARNATDKPATVRRPALMVVTSEDQGPSPDEGSRQERADATEPRRVRDRDHVTIGRQTPVPDLRSATLGCPSPAICPKPRAGRKVSDEFTVPLCRGHHREVHRCGDEAAWWRRRPASIRRSLLARCGWKRIRCRQLRTKCAPMVARLPSAPTRVKPSVVGLSADGAQITKRSQ